MQDHRVVIFVAGAVEDGSLDYAMTCQCRMRGNGYNAMQ